MSGPSRKHVRRALLVVLALVAAEQTWRHGRDYVFPDRFATVVSDRIFRGAWQKDWPMRRIVRDHHIKTIVALAHPPTHELAVSEKALAAELGVKWIHIPIVETREPGDASVSDRLIAAAAAVADPANQPVYFHCHHGINRASMVQMAYRMLHCGWTLDQAQAEIARSFGLVAVDHGPDYRSMARFYNEIVLPMRLEQAKAQTASIAEPAHK
jgi:protein tyrosine phosphatase (PTP) superfamily phosphohydrolase (DUF442 family)